MATNIIGIPTTRVTETYTRDRLLNQTQSDLAAISKLQIQLSTGHKFQDPSEDPIAAMQTIALQRLLEQKKQVQSNLSTSQSFLGATDTSLSNISNLLVQIRGEVLGVMGTTSTDAQRQAAVQQVAGTIQQLVDMGNQQFRGRYLFGGSESLESPFLETSSGMIAYRGNEQHLWSYSDVNLLSDTNVTGNQVFGAISFEVKGTATIIPTLTYATRLSDLQLGQGLSQGSIVISDGLKKADGSLNEVTIDLSSANTLGDLAALIKANPPEGRQVFVDVTADRLTIQLNPDGGGNLTIREVGSGIVAQELGIRNVIGTGTNPIIGRALNPILRNTTSLDNVFGSYATTIVHSNGADNDIRLKADTMGSQTASGLNLNDITVTWIPDSAVQAGGEIVEWNTSGTTPTLKVHIADNGSTRAYQVVNAINAAHQNGTVPFSADIDPLDNAYNGLNFVTLNATAKTRDGAGEPLDVNHGLRVVNSGEEHTIDFSTAKTVGDVLNIINGSQSGVIAEINQMKNGLDLRSRVSGGDFMIGENGGITATQFGLRSFVSETTLSSLNYGNGVKTNSIRTPRMAESTIVSTSLNGNLTFRSKQTLGDPNTDYWNGFQVSLVDTGAPPSVNYDKTARTLTINIQSGVTTANQVVQMLAASPAASDFEAVPATNTDKTISDGSGLVSVGSATTAGGSPGGIDFVITRADGVNLYIDVSQAKNIGDVIDAINNNSKNIVSPATPGNPSPDKLYARQAIYGNGIELVDRSGGSGSLVIKQDPSSTAAVDLGLIPQGKNQSDPGVPDHAATLVFPGYQNNILVHGRDPSAPIGGVTVSLDHTISGVVYNENTKTLSVGISSGVTTAAQVVDAINNSPIAALFEAQLNPPNDGTGTIVDSGPFAMIGGNATTKSHGTAVIPGYNNDLTFTANTAGTTYNGVTIQFVGVPGGPGGVAGAVNFGRTGNTITVSYDSVAGANANQIVSAWSVAANWPVPDPAMTDLTVSLDPTDVQGAGTVTDAHAVLQPTTTGPKVITGADVNMQETQGVFTALLRIRKALAENNGAELQRAMLMLDESTTNVVYARADVGARQQGLDVVKDRLATDDVNLKSSLSDNYDSDMVQVVSELTARQTSYQASLMTMGKIMQMSLLNYL